jgi:hypothetical protein
MYMYIVERTQIYLSRDQATALDREAKRRGQTRSHLIREAIDQTYLGGHSADELTAALDDSFGAWRGLDMTGKEYVDGIRSGRRLHELWGERWSAEDEPE